MAEKKSSLTVEAKTNANASTSEKERQRNKIMLALRQKILPTYTPLLIELVKLPTEVCPTVADYLVSSGQIAKIHEQEDDFTSAIQEHILHAHFLSSAWVADFLKGSTASIFSEDDTNVGNNHNGDNNPAFDQQQQKRQRVEEVQVVKQEMIKEFVVSGFTAYLGYSYGYNAVHIDDEKAEQFLEMVENFGYTLGKTEFYSHPFLRSILETYGNNHEKQLRLGNAKTQFVQGGGLAAKLLTMIPDGEKLKWLRSSAIQGYNAAAYALFNFTDGKEGTNYLMAMKPGAHSEKQQEPYFFLWNHFHQKFLNAPKQDDKLDLLGIQAFDYLQESVKRTMDTDDISPLQALYVHCQLSMHKRRAAPKLATMEELIDFLEKLAQTFPPLQELHKYSQLPKAMLECAKILYEIYCSPNHGYEVPADYWYSYLCAARCKPEMKH